MVRLFPVPFRLIADEQQFRKWQWIEARVEKSNDDHRPESHRLFVDTIRVISEPLQSGKTGWPLRAALLDKAPQFLNFDSMEAARLDAGTSLAILQPARVSQLEIKPAKASEWTPDELDKLIKSQKQGGLFDEAEAGREVQLLEKLPFDFYYHCEFDGDGAPCKKRIKLVDWEVGALYRNLLRAHGPDHWEQHFRQKYEQELPARDLRLMMGTMHRFPDQWLGISVFALPRPQQAGEGQGMLF